MESRFDRAGPPDDRWWREPLSHVVSGRKVVLVGGAAAGWTAAIGRLRALGARDLLVVATEGAGAGRQPEARVMIERPPPGDGMMSAMRGAAISLIGHPTATMRAAIAEFDPHGSAIYLGHFLNESPSIDGRPFLAHRRPEWVALEDKTVLAELLASAGITSARSAVVALVDAAGTRWVVSDDDAVRVTSELGREAQDVRIMPFLEGTARPHRRRLPARHLCRRTGGAARHVRRRPARRRHWNLHVDLSGEIAEQAACFDGERWRWAHDGEDADAVVVGAGDFASARFVPERTPVGPSIGAPAAAFWQFFDDEHGTHVGPLTAPRDVTVR